MMNEKKIEEAAQDCRFETISQLHGSFQYVPQCTQNEIDKETELIEGSFIKGAKWAIQEFLKDLWHHKDEIPNGEILYIDHLDFPYGMQWFRDDHYDEDWEAVINTEGIKGWIYVKDILSTMGVLSNNK